MSPQRYAAFAAIFAVVGVGHLLMAATTWTRRGGLFTEGRDRALFNWGIAAGVFFSGSALYLTSLINS